MARLGPVDGGGGGRGGDAAGRGAGAAVAAWLVEVKGVAEVPFMGEERRWRGSEAVVAASEHRVAPLMALRPLAAVVEWRTGGEAGTG